MKRKNQIKITINECHSANEPVKISDLWVMRATESLQFNTRPILGRDRLKQTSVHLSFFQIMLHILKHQPRNELKNTVINEQSSIQDRVHLIISLFA